MSEKYKQAIIIRTDLGMSRGKMCSQAAHASLEAYRKSDEKTREEWENEGGKKIVLSVEGIGSVIKLKAKAQELKLPFFVVRDQGKTEVKPGTITALGVGPDKTEKVDKLIGFLPLLD